MNSLEDLFKYVKRYFPRVADEFLAGAEDLRPGTLNSQAALRMATSPVTPFLEDVSGQAAEYITPFLNQQADAQNQGLINFYETMRERGIDIPDDVVSEREEIQSEDVAPWVLAAASLGRKLPQSKLFKPMSEQGFYSPVKKAVDKKIDEMPATWRGQTSQQWLKNLQREGAGKEIKEIGLLPAMQEIAGDEEESLTADVVKNLVEEKDLLSGLRTTVKDVYDADIRGPSGAGPHAAPEVLLWADQPDLNTADPNIVSQSDLKRELSHGDYDREYMMIGNALGKNPEEVLIQQEIPDDVREEILDYGYKVTKSQAEFGKYERALEHYDSSGNLDPYIIPTDTLDKLFYEEGHWPGFPNIVAHIRTNEREIDGIERLYMEEAQSDWSSHGEREGWEGRPVQEHNKVMLNLNVDEFNSAEHRYLNADNWEEAVKNWIVMNNQASVLGELVQNGITLDYDNIDFSTLDADDELPYLFIKDGESIDPETWDKLPHNLQDAVRRIKSLIVKQKEMSVDPDKALEEIGPSRIVRDKPFKKNWSELTARTLVMRAIEKGLGGIAWTSGDLQTGRNNKTFEEGKGYRDLYDSVIRKEMVKIGKKFGVEPRLVDYGEARQQKYKLYLSNYPGGSSVPEYFDSPEEAEKWILNDSDSWPGKGMLKIESRDPHTWRDYVAEVDGVIESRDGGFSPVNFNIGTAEPYLSTKVWVMDFTKEMIEYLKEFGINIVMQDKKKRRFDEPLLGAEPQGLLA